MACEASVERYDSGEQENLVFIHNTGTWWWYNHGLYPWMPSSSVILTVQRSKLDACDGLPRHSPDYPRWLSATSS